MLLAVALVATVSGCAARSSLSAAIGGASFYERVEKTPYACEVRITRPNDSEPSSRIRRFDARGRPVFGETRLTRGASGAEVARWEGDLLREVWSRNAEPFVRGYCEVVGGCDEPATRTFDLTRLEYDDAGRLVRITVDSEKLEQDSAGAWSVADRHSKSTELRYQADRLVEVKEERGPVRFEYDGDRLVRRVFDEGKFRHESRYEWREGRLAQVEWSGYLQTFEYDAEGRLTRDLLRSENGTKNERLVVWTYDQHGRVATREDGPVPGEGPRQTTAYMYDGGQLKQVLRNGVVEEEYTYQGDCAAVASGHPAPEPRAITSGGYCFTSPGFVVRQCF